REGLQDDRNPVESLRGKLLELLFSHDELRSCEKNDEAKLRASSATPTCERAPGAPATPRRKPQVLAISGAHDRTGRISSSESETVATIASQSSSCTAVPPR